jgi:2-methylisocitrate lyase-like PEP mutase family enzyme
MKSFETFLQLHKNTAPLILGNIWDVNSAKIFESKGYKAIGTSSLAVAKTLGYEDGEQMPFAFLLQLAKRTVEVVNIPLTVDLEAGYSRSITGITENLEKLHDAGVVGINLEDTIAGTPRQLSAVETFKKTLSAAAEFISRKNLKIFLNVRTDGFLLNMPNALAETITRIKSYEKAGADGIFVPCITNTNDIKEVVSATSLPINVMCMPNLPAFDELQSLGVKRISMGPFVNSYANKKTEEVADTILQDNNFSCLFD